MGILPLQATGEKKLTKAHCANDLFRRKHTDGQSSKRSIDKFVLGKIICQDIKGGYVIYSYLPRSPIFQCADQVTQKDPSNGGSTGSRYSMAGN